MLYWDPVTTGEKSHSLSHKGAVRYKTTLISVSNGTIRVHRENGLSRWLD